MEFALTYFLASCVLVRALIGVVCLLSSLLPSDHCRYSGLKTILRSASREMGREARGLSDSGE